MLVPLNEIFDIRYGNQFDLSRMDVTQKSSNSISFIGRSSSTQGVVAYVNAEDDCVPFDAGLITVAMGGSILASFVQALPFYTGQNVKVLSPKKPLTINQKIYYCTAIEANRFRYIAFGREANSTFNTMRVPAVNDIPSMVNEMNTPAFTPEPVDKKMVSIQPAAWRWFSYSDLFDISSSKDENLVDAVIGNTPYISSTQFQNGVSQWVDAEASHYSGALTVARNGSVGSAFFQPAPFLGSPDDIRIFRPKFAMNKYTGIFLTTLIEKEKYRYAYGRKFGTKRMQASKIKLPVTPTGQPDWAFMERYIKSLPYSSNL